MLNNKNLLITGGTGSFGKAFIKRVLKSYPKINKLVIFSRDELKQSQLSQIYDPDKIKCIRYFLGDVRDKDRLNLALRNIDIVIHAAALKQVPAGEYNPFEFVKTNIIGAQNLIEACLNNGVKKLVALSTDKATSPVNLYGATKLCADKLFVAAQNMFGRKNGLIISIVRYGNVFASRGSVVPLFVEQKEKKIITLTDKRMTRFNLFLEQGVDTVLWTLKNSFGGEIVVPIAPTIKIYDLAKIIGKNCKIKVIGRRFGEKVHEELISKNESYTTVHLKKYYIILPEINYANSLKQYKKKFSISKYPNSVSYNSFDNKNYLSKSEIVKITQNYIKSLNVQKKNSLQQTKNF
tara:strand:+ start:422 stop:1471 length:1050 start_codon:yes stop_codon:yes gene_type:complete